MKNIGLSLTFTSSLLLLSTVSTSFSAQTFVTPSRYEGREAPGESSAWPDAGFSAQRIDSSSNFAGLPEGGAMLTGVSFRPSAGVPTGTETTLNPFVVSIAVTDVEPAMMSDTFAENYAGSPTEVFNDVWTATAASSLGGPRPFEYRVPFETPFFYNPAEGNLLINWRFGNPIGTRLGNTAGLDLTGGEEFETRSMWTDEIDSPVGSSNRFSTVLEFTFVPEPSGLSLGLLSLAGIASLRRRRR